MSNRQIIGTLICFVIMPLSYAQERPKIGLALSGGAALGNAHLGVLRQLEAMRIPVDMIAGTSMGSIIGGIYASGLSVDEIEATLKAIDWEDLFNDESTRADRSWRSKLDDRDVSSTLEFGVSRKGFKLPSGLIIGRKLIFELREILNHVQNIHDFDQLPIPFRALGTDLETGDLVVLGKGDLPRAIRASMSIPGVFSPVLYDDRVLVDGGMVQNLPVEALQQMGADIIIAVQLVSEQSSREDLDSLAKVMGQVVDVTIMANVNRSLEKADVAIKVDMEGFTGSQFDKVVEMIPRGVSATQKVANQLEPYRLSEPAYQKYRSKIQRPSWRPIISKVHINETVRINPKTVQARLNIKTGEPLDLAELQKNLDRIYQLGFYQNIDYHLEEIEPEQYHLFIHAEEKHWGPTYLRMGLDLSADFSGESAFNFRSILIHKPLNANQGELKATVAFGETPALDLEWFQPLNHQVNWYVAPRLELERQSLVITSESPEPALADINTWSASIAVGRLLGSYGAMELSYSKAGGNLDLEAGSIILGGQEINELNVDDRVNFNINLDRLNSISYSLRGWAFDLNFRLGLESLGEQEDFKTLSLSGQKLFPITPDISLYSSLSLNTSLDTTPPPQDRFFLGGPLALSGLPINSISGLYGGIWNTAYVHRIKRGSGLVRGAYLAVALELGNLWEFEDDASFDDLRRSHSLLFGVDTILGPLSLGYGVTEDGDDSWYFVMGQIFD